MLSFIIPVSLSLSLPANAIEDTKAVPAFDALKFSAPQAPDLVDASTVNLACKNVQGLMSACSSDDPGNKDFIHAIETSCALSELAQGSAPSLVLTPSEVTNVPIGDSVQYIGTYTVRFPHTREGAEREAQGTLEFTMKLSRQNEWYIVRWRDITLENMTSWSLIKARFIDK